MKKIISILLIGIIGFGILVGCNDKVKEKISPNIDSNMLNKETKDEYKERASKALEQYNVTDIDILTSKNDRKPILNVTIKTNKFLKDKYKKDDIKKFLENIANKLEIISNKFEIIILDKNDNIIAINEDRDIEYY